MITIYNESLKKDKKDDHIIRGHVEEFFENHQYLEFTNILIWIKELNPEQSRGQALFECSVEARLPNQEPVYVSKRSPNSLNGVRDGLEAIKEVMLKRRHKRQDRGHLGNERPY